MQGAQCCFGMSVKPTQSHLSINLLVNTDYGISAPGLRLRRPSGSQREIHDIATD
jgi:hypothetical protein